MAPRNRYILLFWYFSKSPSGSLQDNIQLSNGKLILFNNTLIITKPWYVNYIPSRYHLHISACVPIRLKVSFAYPIRCWSRRTVHALKPCIIISEINRPKLYTSMCVRWFADDILQSPMRWEAPCWGSESERLPYATGNQLTCALTLYPVYYTWHGINHFICIVLYALHGNVSYWINLTCKCYIVGHFYKKTVKTTFLIKYPIGPLNLTQ